MGKWDGLSLVNGLGVFLVAVLPNPNIGIFGGLGLYPQNGTFYTDVVTTLTSVKNNFGRKCNNITLELFISAVYRVIITLLIEGESCG